jgi:dihydroorotase
MSSIFGNIVEEDGVSKGVITFENGVIKSLERITDPRIADDIMMIVGADNFGDDSLIFPGFIDIHTHCREDVSGKDTGKEDFRSASLAALNGGVVCVADMPNNPIVPFTAESYRDKRYLADKKQIIDILLYAAINQGSSPFYPVPTTAKYKQIDMPYKAFMGPSTNHSGDLNFSDEKSLSEALSRYSGKSVSFHCEDPAMLEAMKNEPTHETRRTPEAEYTAIDTACDLIEKFNLRGKICHVSTQAGLLNILEAKARGVNVTCEVTPHHLYFDTSMLNSENRRWLQMNPPLRPKSDRDFLLQAVRDGKIDYLATDHAPHLTADKLKGMSGVPMLDTYGSFVAWLIKEQKVDPFTIFKMSCKNPGGWVEQFWEGKKIGRIKPGYAANFTVLNMSKTAIDERPLYTKCAWSPFDLRTLPGVVQAVWYNGEKVIDGQYMKGF